MEVGLARQMVYFSFHFCTPICVSIVLSTFVSICTQVRLDALELGGEVGVSELVVELGEKGVAEAGGEGEVPGRALQVLPQLGDLGGHA